MKSAHFIITFWILALMTPAIAQQPPIIDRELFFGDPEITNAQLSPDGKYIAFIKPWNGTRNIWVKKTEDPFDKATLISADTKRPIPAYMWSRDGKYVLFVQDKAGDENYNLFAVNPSDAPAGGEAAPPARNLTPLAGVRVAAYAVPKSEPDVIYVGLNDRDKAWHDLYKIKISTGQRTLLRQNQDRITGWVFDNKDQLRLATRSTDSGDTEILRVDPDGLKKIYSCDVFESCGPEVFTKDDRRVYIATNHGDGVNLVGLELLDPQTGATQVFESDPLKRVDLGAVLVSDLRHELLATAYVDDKVRLYWKDKSYEADYNLIKKKLPGKEIGFNSHTDDEQLWLISAASDTEPGETYLFDRRTKQLTLQYRIREKLERRYLASMQPVRFKSSDGLEIPAYLTLPKGLAPKNLPAILLPHGGPWARDEWRYDGLVQFLANRGYAVLQPNFRGSTGYGKKFLNAGNLQWGDKMQDDITWGAKYLMEKGIADPKRIGIMGGSYGGYATLAGVAFTPDLYAAAVAYVAPSNLITLMESIPPYWEAARATFYRRMGDPNTTEGKAQLERQSPLNSASRIKTPLLVVQGANDPRVNKRESDQIVIALRDRKFPVEYIVAPDEGHGFARPVNNMALYAAAEKFLAKHLSGRYQDGGTPETMKRLKEITVDPATVVMPKKVEAPAGVPQVVAGFSPGQYRHKGNIKAGETSMDLSVVTSIQETPDAWKVIETTTLPSGEISDTTTLDKRTLTVLTHTLRQGPVLIDLAFKDNRLKGKIGVNGQEKPLDVDVGGPLFADGAGAMFAIGALPLAEGYSVEFRGFDLQTMKAKLQQLKVTGSEKVTVPAGSFDCYRVEISSADGGAETYTAWIAKDSRKPVKFAASLPQMGGAQLTAELQ
jgi:dipeptidyl aminopeptidase/acylaminoacyl peptidase